LFQQSLSLLLEFMDLRAGKLETLGLDIDPGAQPWRQRRTIP
jgi:hypothetical protein